VRRYVQQREALFFKHMHDLTADAHCLEIGCGCGVGARIIQNTFAPFRIDALDIDQKMLDLAKRKQAAWGLQRLQLVVGDAQCLPYGDETFDAVFNFGIVHHLEDWQQGIREVSRVLKPDGCFYFEEIYPPLYANFLFKFILKHPRENRFHGPEFRSFLDRCALQLQPGFKESRFAVLGTAKKSSSSHGT